MSMGVAVNSKLLGAMGSLLVFHMVGDESFGERPLYQWGTIKQKAYRHAGADVKTVNLPSGKFAIEADRDAYRILRFLLTVFGNMCL